MHTDSNESICFNHIKKYTVHFVKEMRIDFFF